MAQFSCFQHQDAKLKNLVLFGGGGGEDVQSQIASQISMVEREREKYFQGRDGNQNQIFHMRTIRLGTSLVTVSLSMSKI